MAEYGSFSDDEYKKIKSSSKKIIELMNGESLDLSQCNAIIASTILLHCTTLALAEKTNFETQIIEFVGYIIDCSKGKKDAINSLIISQTEEIH